MSTPELASSYAALILADDGVEVTVRTLFETRPDFVHAVRLLQVKGTKVDGERPFLW